MAGEGPPFLTVGTDVSAKYRGAFCEAKVKVVKKLVKCKINFKDGTNSVVSDDAVKGTLKVGARVEVKQTENGPYVEGILSKLNDASLYTVVFDDGDEKTLRRTLLCLQGEKHFHESETLDHLPLTDPENFGTPVVRDSKKMRRKRRMSNRSQRSDEGEDDDEDSDSDSPPKKQRKEEPEDAVGKVVVVETSEKRKNAWFPALVVDPSCTKDVQTRGKDQIVVRSFKDNKFYTVAGISRRAFVSKDHTYKGDVSTLKSATEKAVTFIDTGQLPSNWDHDMLQKKTKHGHIEQDDNTSEDSSDDEYDMEKDAWLASLHKFMEERGTPINKPPVLGYRDLNLYKLYKLVQDQGGCRKVTDRQLWRHIMTKMGIPASATPQPYNIHTAYNKYLFAFEEFNRKMGPGPRVFTRTRRRSFDRGWISPPIISRQRSVKQDMKDDHSDKEEEESPSKRRPSRKKLDDSGKQKEKEPEEIKRETRESKAKGKDQDKEAKEEKDREERGKESHEREKKGGKKSAKEEKLKEKQKEKGKDKLKDEKGNERLKEERGKDKLKEERGKDKPKEERGKDKPKEERGKDKPKEERGKDKPKEERGKDKPKEEKVKEKIKEEKVKEKIKEEKTKEEKGKERTKDDRGKEKPNEEKGKEKLKESKGKDKGKEDKGREKGKSKEEKSKDEEDDANDNESGYDVGERVLVQYGRGRTEKIYEAKVVDIEMKGKDHVFTVHYTGWNVRYDEAVKKNRIVGSAEKKRKRNTLKWRGDKEKDKKDIEKEKREKEEQEKKDKEDTERREREEKERRAQQEKEKELQEKQEKERLEKEKAEKERQEKEKIEKLERERKEKQEKERKEKLEKEKERLEKERKEKQEREKRERQEREKRERQERERKERLEREKEKQERERKEKQEKERKEKMEKEKLERERKEKQEKEKKERQEKEKRERQEREKREKQEREMKEKLEQERKDKELAEKAKEAEREKREKERSGKESKRTPTSKRGRPSLAKASPSQQSSPRSSGVGKGKSPSPAPTFTHRSMRSDRKSLTESPFAGGLEVVRPRPRRSSGHSEYRRGTQEDSESDIDDDINEQSGSPQYGQDSEDSQVKEMTEQKDVNESSKDEERNEDNEIFKTNLKEENAAYLTKISEDKPRLCVQDDADDGPPTLTAQVGPEASESTPQDEESEAPKVEEVVNVPAEKEGRSRPKKDSKLRLRKSSTKGIDSKELNKEIALEVKQVTKEEKDGATLEKEVQKEEGKKEDEKEEKMDETPILERQVPVQEEIRESLKEKVEELKQENEETTSDLEKKPEKRKGRKKGRRSLDGKKRSKSEKKQENEEAETKLDDLEKENVKEPKKKQAKGDKKKSDKTEEKKTHDKGSKTVSIENTDSDVGSSSLDEKSMQGTSKSFMTTPPTTPESSPKMPSSPSQEEDMRVKADEQSSNKSDSDALIEVASIDDKETSLSRSPDVNTTLLNSSFTCTGSTKDPTSAAKPDVSDSSPKKRRRGTSESESSKKRRKHSRRRQSSISERRRSSTKERSPNSSSDTDESRSESRMTANATKHQPISIFDRSGSDSAQKSTDTSRSQGTPRQPKWNFLVDLSQVKEPDERIAIIQRQLSELRKIYMSLKAEVASIDRRRKKFRRKEREAAQAMAGVAMGHCSVQLMEKTEMCDS